MKRELPTLDIANETAARTKARMAGGWLLNIGALPKTRHLVIEWQSQVVQRWLDARAHMKADGEAWYGIAEILARILGCTLGQFELRLAALNKSTKEQPHEPASHASDHPRHPRVGESDGPSRSAGA